MPPRLSIIARFKRSIARHPRLVRGILVGTTFVGALGAGGAYGGWALACRGGRCPSIEILESYTPRQTSTLFAADGRFIAELGLERRTLVKISDIPVQVRNAFVVTEDKRFYGHSGIDWIRVPGAALHNVRAGAWVEGFSTITMQLARNIFPEHLTRDKSPIRKLKEAKVARAIEAKYPKDKILELYLNQINLGAGAYGVETASQRYFGKSVRHLNLAEAATLAALPKAPGRYNPRRFPERAIQRRNTVIGLMSQESLISDADASLARAYPLRLARRSESGEIAPYFVEWVRQQLDDRFGARLYEQGLKVYTTLDLDMQSAAERALENQLRAIEGGKYGAFKHLTYEQYVARAANRDEPQSTTANSPYIQGAFVALDPRDGAVRALVGGRDFDDSKFNRAVQALRQPGSTFKPIVYSTAIESGRTPATIIDDAPISVPQMEGKFWTPQNYDGKFEGTVTMRRALYNSRNLPAIRMGMELTEPSVIGMARRFGISTPIPPYPSIHIGAADVYPIELIASYSTFANLGTRSDPLAIRRVENQRGQVLWEPTPESEPVLSPAAAWLMVSMMKDVVLRGSAYGSVWGAGFHVPSGGKTGTTNDGADVWFVGYTADLVAGTWMGFDRPQKIKANAQGGILAAPAYTSFMTEVYRRKPTPPDWPRPEGVVAREIDATTGELRNIYCPTEAVYTEYFLAGTEPIRSCAIHSTRPVLPIGADTTTGVVPLPGTRPPTAPTPLDKRARPPRDTSNPFKIPR
jgi:penicillin-binding protein 1A